MSCAFIVFVMLLGSSVAIAFVLHPSSDGPAASDDSPATPHRCHGESWQSIRKSLLSALGLQAEPRLPAGGLDSVREKWQRTFSPISHRIKFTSSPAGSDRSVSPDSGNSTSMTCCSMASEVFIKDLGWDNWVIHPLSFTIIQCAFCNSADGTVQCPAPLSSDQDANSQDHFPCCQPTSQETVPVVYMDESLSVVISSVQLPSSCGCGPGSIHQP